MSNQVYFGKCISSGSSNQKTVYMKEMPERFNEGDLLAVFFTNRNTASTPSIVFKVGSTQQEVSVADDEGILIKSHDVDVEKDGLWGNGETVLFCFVKRPNENINTQNNESEGNENENAGDNTTSEEEPKSNGVIYLEIIGKLQASEDDYGIVKLNGITADETLEDWLKRDEAADDYKAAINTATVKALIKALFAIQDEDEEEEQPISFGLQWIRNPALTEELFPLGDLSLGNSSTSVSIGIPKNLITQEQIQYTGQLINNGMDGTHNPDEENYPVEPFLTRHIPNDLFFEPGDEITPAQTPRAYLPGHGIALEGADLTRIKPKEGGAEGETEEKNEATIPYHIRFDKDKLVLGHNDSADFHKVIIRPALKIEGPTQASGIIDADSEINGKKIYGGSLKPSWSETAYGKATIVSEGDIYEKNDLLKNRYSGKLKVVLAYSGNDSTTNDPITITKDTFHRFKISYTPGSNWRPIGIVGYNIDSATTANRKDLSWANVVECFLVNQENVYDTINGINTLIRPKTDSNAGRTNDIEMAIYNMNTSKSIQIRVKVYVLCEYVGL